VRGTGPSAPDRMAVRAIAGLRPATVADAPAVTRLVRAAYGHYVARIGRPPYPMTVDYAALPAAQDVFVVERDGTLLGVLLLEAFPDFLMVENVAVDPAVKGGGLGKALMAFAETEARRRGLPELRLYTHAMMTENQAIYRHLGFVEIGRREVDGRPRVYMAKDLGPPAPGTGGER